MKKTILSIALICTSLFASAQSFSLTYPFTAVTTTTGVLDPTPAPTAVGVTSGSFLAVGASTASTAGGRFSFTAWPTGATTTVDTYSTMTGSINPGAYYEIIITPTPGYTVGLNTIDFTVQRSGTGIRSYVVKTSADGFTSNLPASTGTSTALSIVGTNEFFWNLDATTSAQNGSSINLFGATITSSVSFRFYGWNSEASTGSFSIDNVVINGVSTTTVACPSPTITSITSNGPICSGSNLTLQCAAITSTGSLSYSWAGTGSFSSMSVSNPTVTGAATGDYSLTVSNGCATTSTVISVVVNSTPTVIVNSASICSGGTATLIATGATSYSWTPAIGLSSTTGSLVTSSPATTTIYTVTGTTGLCAHSVSATVSVVASPTITVNSATICNGSFVTLTAAGATSYTWTSPVSTSNTISVNPTTTTVYTVTGGAAGCAGSYTASGIVTVNPNPTLSVSTTSSLICIGQMVTLTASGATSYTWTNSVINGTAFSPTITATYTVTGSIGTCTNTSVKTVSVSTCTGIDESINVSSFTIYPNPNTGVFNIQATILPATLVIYDITGKKIITKTLTEMETSINISDLNNGIYFSNISNDKSSMNYKIVLSK